jgi:hypothetical protein
MPQARRPSYGWPEKPCNVRLATWARLRDGFVRPPWVIRS